ncbi:MULTISPECIES: phenylacetate--CoA ligase family protein [unclassified Inquilinus]|uniref:phenylacetate--CoA ligase family protein n=1 Tax=unclassified Inquilinus TaxID=2645927 RepID=UPI003F8D947D
MTDHYDDLETRPAEAREKALLAELPAQIAHAKAAAPGYAKHLAAFDPAAVTSRAELAELPLTRKSDLTSAQALDLPFGGMTTLPPGRLRRIFASPGPIYEGESHGIDHWRTARALFATGFREGDILQNCFSYHFTPAGVMFETGAEALGCAVIPAGTGNTELQARTMADLQPRGYVGTPDFLKLILEKADQLDHDTRSVTLAHVSGGPLLPPLREFYSARGIDVFQSYGTADLGLIAYETEGREGLVLAEGILVEIVRPGTGEPVPEGEVGEVVVTSFDRCSPLIRFATGDLSAILPGRSPCGRTAPRLRGWLGRADQSTKVRGMFVHPGQVAEVLKRHDLARGRLVVASRQGIDEVTLQVEAADAAIADAVAETLADVTKLHAAVAVVPPGGLPNDGKVIDDTRKFA